MHLTLLWKAIESKTTNFNTKKKVGQEKKEEKKEEKNTYTKCKEEAVGKCNRRTMIIMLTIK